MTGKQKDKQIFKKKILKPQRQIGTGCFKVQPQEKSSTKKSQNVAHKLSNSRNGAFKQEQEGLAYPKK